MKPAACSVQVRDGVDGGLPELYTVVEDSRYVFHRPNVHEFVLFRAHYRAVLRTGRCMGEDMRTLGYVHHMYSDLSLDLVVCLDQGRL